ncbi:ABC transporter permease [Paenibacillus sepulcri]|uniref:ABC transporter permease subunit n=1 Tax=Paenibacillus sepulcri TaxID=359917 RepID=A0ABS7C202_9BACL|nr:ABC transporter permease subunit [Paenibacillus sepulcri]
MDRKPQSATGMVLRNLSKTWQLYILLLPSLLYFFILHYIPLYGVQIAFKEYIATRGIWGSPWVGFDHFQRFFNSYYFKDLIRNTLVLNVYGLLLFPLPIILALSFNEVKHAAFKKWAQTITYAPHFISTVVMAGMIIAFLDPETGLINNIIKAFGGDSTPFLIIPHWFKHIFVWSGQWQGLGWGAIIYLAALAGVNPDLHDAASVDGASRMRRIWHINIPAIMPTIIILFILTMGSFMSIGFEKVLLLQNALNMSSSDVIQTFVYRSGLLQSQYSFSAAVGLFDSLINVVLLVTANQIARKTTENSLW